MPSSGRSNSADGDSSLRVSHAERRIAQKLPFQVRDEREGVGVLNICGNNVLPCVRLSSDHSRQQLDAG